MSCFQIILSILGFIVLCAGVFLAAALLTPVSLIIDTDKKYYILSFFLGKIQYCKADEKWGISYQIFWKKGRTSIKQLLSSKSEDKQEKEQDKEEEKIETKKKPKKEKDKQDISSILGILLENKALLKQIIKKLLNFAVKIIKTIKVKLDGTFFVSDPYYLGLCYAVLYPFNNSSIMLLPNFCKRNYLKIEAILVPMDIVMHFMVLVLTLPYFKIYKVYKSIKSKKPVTHKYAKAVNAGSGI